MDDSDNAATVTTTATAAAMATVPSDASWDGADGAGPPAAAHRTLSAQRVPVVVRPDGSLARTPARPHAPVRDSDAALHHPTVAAPVSTGVPGVAPDAPPPPPQLAGAPLAPDALAESAVTRRPGDDARAPDADALAGAGHAGVLDARGALVGGLSRGDVWALVRRFDKQVQHVREIPPPPPGCLDLCPAADDQFAPEKLRANLERLYLTIILGLVAFGKHLMRLSSWEDSARTAAFCVAYFVSWYRGLLVPALLALVAALIAFPRARTLFFPPLALAVVRPHEGGNAPAPPAPGEARSGDTLTGAPEAQKGEAAEQEASNFVSGIAMVAVGAASGTAGPSEKPRDHGDDEPGAVPDPTELAGKTTEAIGTAESGRKQHTKEDKTKQPMMNAAWEYSKTAMQVIGMICDTWEKLANALSPTPPFHRRKVRARLAGLLVPLMLVVPFISYDLIFSGLSFGIGIAFFGQKWLVPLSKQGFEWLNENYPNWPQQLDIFGRLLRTVPTNAQLTLTLLRIAEAQNAPLPPPPSTAPSSAPPPPPAQGSEPDFSKGAEDAESESGESYVDAGEHEEAPESGAATGRKGARARLAGLLRGTAKVGASTVEGTHRLKAATVGGGVRDKVGVLPPRVVRGHPAADGPDSFFARHHGRKGHLLLDIDPQAGGAAAAHVLFEPGREDGSHAKPPTVGFEVAKVTEVRKVGGLGWKGKLVAGWALGEDVPDGLEVKLRDGTVYRFTAMPRRDEFFDRLIAMGGQRWESC